MQDPINAKQIYIVAVSLLSVLLWCLNSVLQRWTGEMGIIAILPMVAFYGFGILTKVLNSLIIPGQAVAAMSIRTDQTGALFCANTITDSCANQRCMPVLMLVGHPRQLQAARATAARSQGGLD